MNMLLQIALGNALMTTALAVLVALIARFCRRPALIHSLWVLVLLKLITPSFVACPVTWFDGPEPSASRPGLPAIIEPARRVTEAANDYVKSETILPADMAELDLSGELNILPEMGDMQPISGPPASVAQLTVNQSDSVSRVETSIPWIPLLGSIWITGSIACFLLIVYRIYRFRSLLAYVRPPSPALREQVQRLADHLGLAVCPAVWLVPGKVSPMVWALGRRPQLFLPSALWERLREEQRSALLVHELAHLLRHDQWIRALELAVTILYWWHPAVWWACREIREAEEQCCDAWVVWTLPRAARAYATALLQTIDFLSETRVALPAVASGIGHVRDLRRRLTMIMHGTTPRGLSGPSLVLVLGLGASLLPLLPTWTRAQDPETRERRAVRQAEEQQRVAEERQREAEEAERADTQDRARASERQALRAERQAVERQVEEMRRHAESMKRELQRAMEQLQTAEKRLSELQTRDGRREPEAGRASTPRLPTARREGSRDSERRLSELEQKLDALIQEVQSLRREMRRSGPAMRGPGAGMRPPTTPGPMPAPALESVPSAPPPTPGRPALPGAAPRSLSPAVAPAAPVAPAPPAALAVPAASPDPRPIEAPQPEVPR